MKTYNENEFSDTGSIPTRDFDTGEIIRDKKVSSTTQALIKWAEDRMGNKFVNYKKQASWISRMHNLGYTDDKIKECWERTENDDFWGGKGFDFAIIANEISKKPKASGLTIL